MSQKGTTEPIGRLEVTESSGGDLSKIAELARQAYDQRRTTDCLDLTRAMLLIDPDNADAQSMRFSIQSEIHRDLDNARAFLRQARNKDNSERPSQPDTAALASFQDSDSLDQQSSDLPAFVLSPPTSSGISRRTRVTLWLSGAGALVFACVMVAILTRSGTNTNALYTSLLAAGESDKSRPAESESVVTPDPLLLKPTAELYSANSPARVAPPVPATSTIRTPVPGPVPAPIVAAAASDRPVVAGSGKLAVSSPASVDIYENDVFLGSAPVSLELSSGAHTLEYRHGSMRKTLTHIINSNETSKTTITFDVSVQINSRPWAEVFMDGVARKDLGQTPLSGVQVPIGSVLIFENPQFQPKKYRVTGNETGIQVVFP